MDFGCCAEDVLETNSSHLHSSYLPVSSPPRLAGHHMVNVFVPPCDFPSIISSLLLTSTFLSDASPPDLSEVHT